MKILEYQKSLSTKTLNKPVRARTVPCDWKVLNVLEREPTGIVWDIGNK